MARVREHPDGLSQWGKPMSTQASGTEKSIVGEADPKAIKRAQWETFEFTMEAPGMVRVSNESHEDGKDHSYLVNIETDTPVACECPAFEYGDGSACKHIVAVAIREPVLLAVQRELVTDGGEDPDSCKNGQTGCCGPEGDGLPCFECYLDRERDRDH